MIAAARPALWRAAATAAYPAKVASAPYSINFDTKALANGARGIYPVSSTEEAVKLASCVVLAVKPQVMAALVKSIAVPAKAHRPLFVSIAAGVREDALSGLSADEQDRFVDVLLTIKSNLMNHTNGAAKSNGQGGR